MYGMHEYLVLKLVEQRLQENLPRRQAHLHRQAEPSRRRPLLRLVVRGRRRVLLRLSVGF